MHVTLAEDMIDVIVGWEGAGSEYVTGMGATAVPSEISARLATPPVHRAAPFTASEEETSVGGV